MLRSEDFVAPFKVQSFGPEWDCVLPLGQRIGVFFESHNLNAKALKHIRVTPCGVIDGAPYGLCVIIYNDEEVKE